MKDRWRTGRIGGALVLAVATSIAAQAPRRPCDIDPGASHHARVGNRLDQIEALTRAVAAAPHDFTIRLDLARCQASSRRPYGALPTLQAIATAFAAAPSAPDDATYFSPAATKRVPATHPKGDAGTPDIVVVEATIQPNGRVLDAKVAEPRDADIDKAALRAAKQWRFQPRPEASGTTYTSFVPILVSRDGIGTAVNLIDVARFLARRGRTRLAGDFAGDAIARLERDRAIETAELRKCFGASVPEIVADDADRDATPAKILKQVDPKYTYEAMMAKVNGSSELLAVVDPQGAVVCAWITAPLEPSLDAQAIAAVRQWRFAPVAYGGRPVMSLVPLIMTFRLR